MLLLPSLTDNLDSHKEMNSLAGGGMDEQYPLPLAVEAGSSRARHTDT